MVSDNSSWTKVAESIDELVFGPNDIAERNVAGKHICMARYNGELFAFGPKCPHAGGWFRDGFIDALGNVVCPLHRYKFCLKNGSNVSGEGYYLKHWPVVVREDGVYISWERKSFF